MDVEDKAVTILKKIKAESQEGDEEEPKITFEDYEKLMQALEKDGRAQQLEEANPRAQLARRLQH